jgi:hypothetical protein
MDEARVVRSFEDLVVFQRAYRVSLEVHRKSLVFPQIERARSAIRFVGRANRFVRISPKGSASSGNPLPSSSAFC